MRRWSASLADRIRPYEIDLVPVEAKQKSPEKRIRGINLQAPIFHAQLSKVDPKLLVALSAFNLDGVLGINPGFLNTEDEHQHAPVEQWPLPPAFGRTRSTSFRMRPSGRPLRRGSRASTRRSQSCIRS